MAVRPTLQSIKGLSIGATVPVSAATSTGAIIAAQGVDLTGITLIPKSPDVIKNIFEKTRPGTPVLRVDDLVAMRVELRNCTITPGKPPIIRKSGSRKGRLVLHFPPQSITEETFYEPPPKDITDPGKVPPEPGDPPHPIKDSEPKPEPGDPSVDETLREPPIRARSADESRLVFDVPADAEIEYSLAGILEAVQSLKLVVAANAKPRTKKVKPGLVIPIKDLLNVGAVNALSVKKRAALSAHVAASFRLAAQSAGDTTTLRARQNASNTNVLTNIPDNIGVGIGTIVFPTKGPEPRKPSALQTAIEMPWRLYVSPHAGAGWRHAAQPVHSPATSRTELWHTRMVTPKSDGSYIRPPYPDPNRTIRAIWARRGFEFERASKPMQSEYPDSDDLPDTSAVPFRQPLDNYDRYQIVHLSSNFGNDDYHPEPVDTKLMMLSSLGGWLDSRGAWDPVGLSVEEWVHRAAMARDHYVKVVYRGFLCPFGHRVSLVKVTERKFHKDKDSVLPDLSQNAYLRQRFFIIIREHVRHFDDSSFHATQSVDGEVNFARQFPFAKVEILTDQTPDLDDPNDTEVVDGRGQQFFWPHVGEDPFQFQCVGTDLDGRRIAFDLPMIFMDNTIACPRNNVNDKLVPAWTLAQNNAADAAEEYNANPLHTTKLDFQKLSLATPNNPGDSAVDVETVTFNMEAPERQTSGQNATTNTSLRNYSRNLTRPLFVPKVYQVKAKLGPVAHLTGSGNTNTLRWNEQYLKVGFNTDISAPEAERNIGEVFADVIETGNMGQLDFSSQGDKSGGFLQPNIKPLALSRTAGPIMTNPEDFAKGILESGAGFPTAPSLNDLPLPLLFGCIPLGELIQLVANISGEPEKVPKFASEAGTQVETFVSTLLRFFNLAIDLPKGPLGVAMGALQQFVFKTGDLIDQGQVVPQEMQQAIDKLNEMLGLIEALRDKIESAANAAVDAIGTDPDFTQALADIPALKAKVGELKGIVNGPQGSLIPANIRQQLIAFADGLETMLEAIEDAQAVFAAGKAIFEKVDAIVGDPSALAGLLENPGEFGNKLGDLNDAIEPFRNAIADFDLLPEAVRAPIVSALKEVEEVFKIAEVISDILEALTGDELTIRFDWNPEIASWPNDANALFRANDKKGLVVAVEGKVKKNGASSPQISVSCSLRSFDLVLIAPASFIELNFDKISFAIDSAAKMDVDVLLKDIKFVGPLSFVETLRDLIPLDGFSDPPYLDITTEGIHAGFDIALPTVAVGVLNISNLSLGAGFTVPFIGQPLSVGFNFCTREQPFCLTVYMFGGGGFFGITIDPQGVQILEAAFEFGASLSIDFGVASGGVEVMAGIYFRMEQDEASLTGYFRLGGHVDVLGLISASIELYLELEYEFSSGKCTGRAELTIEVSVFVFSGSVTIKCEKKFAGSNGDPSLRQMMGHQPELPLEQELAAIDGPDVEYGWREYAEAFA